MALHKYLKYPYFKIFLLDIIDVLSNIIVQKHKNVYVQQLKL